METGWGKNANRLGILTTLRKQGNTVEKSFLKPREIQSAVTMCRTKEIALYLLYMESGTLLRRIFASICMDGRENILDVKRSKMQNWVGTTLEVLLHPKLKQFGKV